MSPETVMLSLSSATIFILLITLSAASFVYSRLWRECNLHKAMGKTVSEGFFVTARKAGSTWLLTGAFYSGLSGAWLPMTSAYYGATYGIFGILTSSLLLGVEPLVTTLVSRAVALTLPMEVSLPASICTRYGRVLELYTLAVMVLSELTCLTSEYICVLAVFSECLSLHPSITLCIFASFSVCYTVVGGALVGLFTAQFHCALAIAAVAALVPYFATITPRLPPRPFAPASPFLFGPSRAATLTSLILFTYQNAMFALFFNSLWQKTVCARSPRSTLRAALQAGALLTLVASFFGFTGSAAILKDATPPLPAAPYAGTAHILYLDPAMPTPTTLRSIFTPTQYWLGLTFVIFCAVSSKAAIESWSDGLLCGVYGSLRLRRHRLLCARVVVLSLNSFCALAASHNLSVLGLYFLSNIACATLSLPLFLSLTLPHLSQLATSPIIIASSVSGILACSVYGVSTLLPPAAPAPRPPLPTTLKLGLQYAFYTANYAWQVVLLSLAVPLATYTMLMSVRYWLLRRAHAKQLQRAALRGGSGGGTYLDRARSLSYSAVGSKSRSRRYTVVSEE